MTIVNLEQTPKTRRGLAALNTQLPKQQTRAMARKLRRQSFVAIGLGFVAAGLTAMSLSHLADGIRVVTGAESWQAWTTAVGIDLGYIGLEISQVTCATESVRKQVRRVAQPAIIGTLTWSAAMNAFGFASNVESWSLMSAAILLGISIPALIWAISWVATSKWLDCHNRA